MKNCVGILLMILLLSDYSSGYCGIFLNYNSDPGKSMISGLQTKRSGVDYYIDARNGDDNNPGTSEKAAFRSLARTERLKFKPGDRILLASGQVYHGELKLIGCAGTREQPIEVLSLKWGDYVSDEPAIIDFRSHSSGILLQDCSFVKLCNVVLTADGYRAADSASTMRCGILIVDRNKDRIQSIKIEKVKIRDVFYENKGYERGKQEVYSANGTQKYGWGIRIICADKKHQMSNIQITNCEIQEVGHTGIKLTGNNHNIKNVQIQDNKVYRTGGPGIQMSGVQFAYVSGNNK